VRKFARELRKYKGEEVSDAVESHLRYLTFGQRNKRSKRRLDGPKEPRGTTKFLSQYSKGTYQHWLVSADIEKTMEAYRKDYESFKKEEKRINSLNGLSEKKEAIQDALSQLERVEVALLEKGAKTFKELYPNIETMSQSQDFDNEDTDDTDYNLDFGFGGVKDLTSCRKDAYFRL
jgi:hypothetical protein